LLHSDDRGNTWKLQPTGQTLPINALAFANRGQGVAVGTLGLVLTTADGGTSWQLARGGPRRAAAMVVASSPEAMPLELLARLSGGEGYRGVAVPLFATLDSSEVSADYHRATQALSS